MSALLMFRAFVSVVHSTMTCLCTVRWHGCAVHVLNMCSDYEQYYLTPSLRGFFFLSWELCGITVGFFMVCVVLCNV